MKILVVEDDRRLARSLQLLLSTYHYAVDIAEDGEVGWQMADIFEYDLLLLDILLPRLDGIGLCQKVRQKGVLTPILLLTGQGGGRQKANALNAGADDYVVKPFDVDELIARVQALLRRGSPQKQPLLQWGALSVDPSRREVAYRSHSLSVTPKEYAILELFLRYPHKVFSASAIVDRVWSSLDSPGEETVRFHIKELRKKLKAIAAPPDLIETVYRVGYRLNPLFANAIESPSEENRARSQIAELQFANKELHSQLTALQLTQTSLIEKNRELAAVCQTLEEERRQLQVENEALKRQIVET